MVFCNERRIAYEVLLFTIFMNSFMNLLSAIVFYQIGVDLRIWGNGPTLTKSSYVVSSFQQRSLPDQQRNILRLLGMTTKRQNNYYWWKMCDTCIYAFSKSHPIHGPVYRPTNRRCDAGVICALIIRATHFFLYLTVQW